MPRLLFYFDYCSWIDNRGDLVGDLQFELLELFVFVVLIGRANSLGCLRNGGVNRGVNSSWPFLLLCEGRYRNHGRTVLVVVEAFCIVFFLI